MTIEELSEEYVKSTLIGSESIKKNAYKAGAYKVLEEIEKYIMQASQKHEVGVVWLHGLLEVIIKLKGKE